MKIDLIAYCGVDCSACTDYADNKCLGCRKTKWENGDECLPVKCCKKRGIEFCGSCPEFPCDTMKGFYEESESHKLAFKRMYSLRDKDST